MPENPDAEKAALAEALSPIVTLGCRYWLKPQGHEARHEYAIPERDFLKAKAVLANLSPAAKEILAKAQAHDVMAAENERLRLIIRHALDARSAKVMRFILALAGKESG